MTSKKQICNGNMLPENEKDRYRSLIQLSNGQFTMNTEVLTSALQVLSKLLYKHYGKSAIILIDEYDVP